ncbi:MAG: AsmA family protein, partial [Planctomycetota bacterium]
MRKALLSLSIIGVVLLALAVVNGVALLSDRQLEARAQALLDRVLQVPFALEQVRAERRGLIVRGLSIGGGPEPVITVEEAVLELSGLELGLGAIRLTRPVIRIHRDAVGDVNLFGLLDPKVMESAGGPTDLPPLLIACEGAKVVFRDERLYGPGESLTISDLNADISIESSQLFARAHFQPRWAKEASMVVR